MQETSDSQNKDGVIKEILENGVQYGRAKRFTNPKLKEFLLKSNKTVEIFDVVKILEKIDDVVDYIKQILDEKKTILFVGVQSAADEEIKKIAKLLEQPYLVYKWVGGFLTNFSTIRTRVKFFEELKEKKEIGELDNYSPVEKNRVLRELEKMENVYGGVLNLLNIPDVIFVVNLEYKPHRTMQRESARMGIPIVGICGSDNNPDKFKIFIPANDKAPSSIKWILEYIIKKLGFEQEQQDDQGDNKQNIETEVPEDIAENTNEQYIDNNSELLK